MVSTDSTGSYVHLFLICSWFDDTVRVLCIVLHNQVIELLFVSQKSHSSSSWSYGGVSMQYPSAVSLSTSKNMCECSCILLRPLSLPIHLLGVCFDNQILFISIKPLDSTILLYKLILGDCIALWCFHFFSRLFSSKEDHLHLLLSSPLKSPQHQYQTYPISSIEIHHHSTPCLA